MIIQKFGVIGVILICLGQAAGNAECINANGVNQAKIYWNIQGKTLIWGYSNCSNLKCSVYFADSTQTLQELASNNPEIALKYMTLVLTQEISCNKNYTYSIPYKGDLIFVIVSEISFEIAYEVVNYASIERYFCKFSDFSDLEIQKSSKGLLFNPYSNYNLYNHGSISNTKGIIGDLKSILCGASSTTLLNSNCKTPELFIGHKISSVPQGSCILQHSSSSIFSKSFGICEFNHLDISGYLVIQPRLSSLLIQGYSTSLSSISVKLEQEYPLALNKISEYTEISGELPRLPHLGLTLTLLINSETTSCTVGIFPVKSLPAEDYSLHGAIIVPLSFLALIISLFVCKGRLIN